MKQESLNKKIDRVIDKLRIAQSEKNEKSIQESINELNKLWEKSSVEMKKNARKDRFADLNYHENIPLIYLTNSIA